MNEELEWTGQTRDAVAANMLTLYEMGDVPRGAWEVFNRDSERLIFESQAEIEAVAEEVRYMIGMGHPEMHRPTLARKVRRLEQMHDETPAGADR